ncbi:hypothetical protein CBR_g4790 [Chara braunii]|uniref:CCHC-type domain-containing protein n=1 Tax=Chara braunii TaxID=69332 RepID=A0A388KJ20_CHABU|nr:hypothetical protein CBR_g4790 [Chara braunii]|eukprot:GBG69963.1 hypothetical protein CBR_g4790 [Chara braunii]
MSRESTESGPTSGRSDGSTGSGGGRPPPRSNENRMAGRTCFRCGKPDHFANVYDEYWDARDKGVPFVLPPPPYVGGGCTLTTGTERRSHSADNYGSRRETDKMNSTMRTYFFEMAKEREEAKQRATREEAQRKEEAARKEQERKRLQELEEKKRGKMNGMRAYLE